MSTPFSAKEGAPKMVSMSRYMHMYDPGEPERGGVEAQHAQRALLLSEGEENRSQPNRDVDRSCDDEPSHSAKAKELGETGVAPSLTDEARQTAHESGKHKK